MFADMTNDEFEEKYCSCLKIPTNGSLLTDSQTEKFNRLTELPDSVDWREEGYVTPVKNQGIEENRDIFSIIFRIFTLYTRIRSFQDFFSSFGSRRFGNKYILIH